jgi:hypothetical protein
MTPPWLRSPKRTWSGAGGVLLVRDPPPRVCQVSAMGSTRRSPFHGRLPHHRRSAPLQFTVAQLSASVARSAAVTRASAALVHALADGAQKLFDAVLDVSRTPQTLTSEVEEIGDSNCRGDAANGAAGI